MQRFWIALPVLKSLQGKLRLVLVLHSGPCEAPRCPLQHQVPASFPSHPPQYVPSSTHRFHQHHTKTQYTAGPLTQYRQSSVIPAGATSLRLSGVVSSVTFLLLTSGTFAECPHFNSGKCRFLVVVGYDPVDPVDPVDYDPVDPDEIRRRLFVSHMYPRTQSTISTMEEPTMPPCGCHNRGFSVNVYG
jgi:hypothetical protein